MSEILTMIREALDADRAAAGDTQHKLNRILEGMDRMSKQLDDLTAQVAANATVETSALALIQGMHDQLVAAGTDADKLEDLKASLSASAASLSAAVSANTPAAPVPTSTIAADPSAPTQVATPAAADTAPVDASTSTTTTTVS